MSRFSSSALLAALALIAPRAAADARFDVAGSVVDASERELRVRIGLANRGDAPASAVEVEGELLGEKTTARLGGSIAPGSARDLVLPCPIDDPAPGVHALRLLISYVSGPSQAMSQPAYVLIALGENAAAAVRLTLPEARIDTAGTIRVGIDSADAKPHRVRLDLALPRGLHVVAPQEPVTVPAAGRVSVVMPAFRADAPWGSRQGLVVTATTSDEAPVRTAAATGVVRVASDPVLMPRLRRPLIVVATLLLVAAVIAEVRRGARGSLSARLPV